MSTLESTSALAATLEAFMRLIAFGCGIPPHAFAVLTAEQRSALELVGITPDSCAEFCRDAGEVEQMISEGGPVKPGATTDEEGREAV